MGQFYKGAEASFIDDAMFKLPYELMGNIIDRKDKEVDATLEANAALNPLLDATGLEPDNPRLKEIIGNYTSEIDSVTNSIYGDVLNASSYMPKINALKKKITQDWTKGEVATIQMNKASYDKWEKELQDKVKAKPDEYSPEQVELLKANKLAEFKEKGGTGYKGPSKYTAFDTEDVLGLKPVDQMLEDLMKGAIPGVDTTVKWESDKGGWTVKGGNETKFFTPNQLETMYTDLLVTNPNIVSAIKQREKLGIAGFQGTFTPEGTPVMQEGNYFSTSLDLLKNKYGGKKTSSTSGKVMNALGVEQEKDKFNTVNLSTEVGGVLTGIAGKTNGEFNSKWKGVESDRANSVTDAIKNYADLHFGGDVSKMQQSKTGLKVYNALRSGDFSPVLNTPEGKTAAATYKRATIDRETLKAQMVQFEKSTGLRYSDITDSSKKVRGKDGKETTTLQAWNDFLNTTSNKTVNRQMTYEGTGLTSKQQESLSTQFFKSGKHMDTPIYFEPGTKIGGADVGGQKFSLNQLIQKGIILPKAVKSPTVGKTAGGIAMESFQIKNSSELLNLDLSKSNFAPIWGYNDSDLIEFGFGVNIAGKTHFGRVDNVSTDIVDRLNSGDNALRFKTTSYLDKNLSNVENYTIPGTDYIYHGAAVKGADGKQLYRPNTLTWKNPKTGKKETVSADDPDVQLLIGNALFK